MKRHGILIVVVLAAIALAAACSKTATNTNNTNTSSNTSSNTSTTSTTNTASTSNATSKSPTDVILAAFDASKNKDVAGFKKTLSSSDIKELDEMTKRSGGSVDDFLKEIMGSPETTMPQTLETRDEKIDGDTATVEFKDKSGDWKTAYFIKEGAEWKMNLGKPSDKSPDSKKEPAGTNNNQGMEPK